MTHFTECSLNACFEESVERYPDRPAIKMAGNSLTYSTFNQQINQIAHALLALRGPKPEAIFLIMDLSIQAMGALLAVLKAGKYYSAPDLKHPPERLAQMIANGQPALIITNNRRLDLARELAGEERAILNLDDSLDAFPIDNPPQLAGADSLFFITYTSGTTGKPKGIYCNHRAALYNALTIARLTEIEPNDVVGNFRYPGFTPGYNLAPLLTGASLSLFEGHNGNLEQMLDWLAGDAITITTFPLGYLRTLLQEMPDDRKLPALRQVSAGSEAMLPSDTELIKRRLGTSCVFRNAYGLTETLGGCVDSYPTSAQANYNENRVPAGLPRPGFEVLILDEECTQLSIGKIGEIAIRSRYLTLGYWRQPELSAERYITDPTDPEKTIFLTGDLGRIDEHGQLIHLGRKDDQVKIRGYRVEPIDVEQALMATHLFREVSVMARPNAHNELMLVAWLVPIESIQVSISDIRQKLLRTLPEYMVPAAYLVLDRLPRTPAQKVDRKALPDPSLSRPVVSNDYRAPSDELEEWLVRCWEDLLEIHPVGVDDNFLELGGDSLQAMRVISRLNAEVNDYFYVITLFDNPTIDNFAKTLRAGYPEAIQQRFGRLDGELLHRPANAEKFQPEDRFEQLQEHLKKTYSRRSRILTSSVKNPPAIFILAPGRSGTTLLRVMLGGHPQLFAPPELYLLEYDNLCDWQSAASEGRGYRAEGVLQALTVSHDCSLEQAEQMLQSYIDAGYSTQQLYLSIQKQIAPRTLVDKTPSYVHSLHTLRMAEAAFEAPLYIHLVRHPAAVIRSFEEVRFDQRNTLVNELEISPQTYAEWNWLIAHQNILQFEQEVPTQRWYRLHFEALVKSPQTTMQQVCNFLHLPFHEGMLQPYVDPKARMIDGLHALTAMTGDPKFHQHKKIDASVADAWQKIQREISLSNRTWQIAERLGYAQHNVSAGGTA